MSNKPRLTPIGRKVTIIKTAIGAPAAVERIRGRKLTRIRDRIAERDGYECKRCGRATADFKIDHVVPLHLGGRESDENRQLLCKACHDVKTAEEEAKRGAGRILTG